MGTARRPPLQPQKIEEGSWGEAASKPNLKGSRSSPDQGVRQAFQQSVKDTAGQGRVGGGLGRDTHATPEHIF